MNKCEKLSFMVFKAMARKEETQTVKLRSSLAKRATDPMKDLGWSFNKLAEYSVETILKMIENPHDIRVPNIIAMLEAARKEMPLIAPTNVIEEPENHIHPPKAGGITVIENMADVLEHFAPPASKAAETPRTKKSAAG